MGLFVGLTPTVGFQMVIAVALAATLRANKVVCIPMVWITNPVTLIPIYAVCHRMGSGLIGATPRTLDVANHEQLATPLQQIQSMGFSRVFEFQFWIDVAAGLTRVGAELWVGCLLAGSIFGTVGYFVSRRAVVVYRQRRAARDKARDVRRRERQRRFANRIRAREPLV